MNKLRLKILVVGLFISFAATAQNIERAAILSGGTQLQNDTLVVNISIGQIADNYLHTDTLHVTQGIQPVKFYAKLLSTETVEKAMFTIYPNPSSDKMYITYPDNRTYNYSVILTATNGQLLEKTSFTNNMATLQVSHLSQAVYFISIINAEKHVVQTFIVQKQ